MAAIIQCECCRKVVPHTKAKHIRVYEMPSATTYDSTKCVLYIDLCDGCIKASKKKLKAGGA